jgi:hypothetical protein
MLLSALSYRVITGISLGCLVAVLSVPRLRFDREVHNFGRILQNKPVLAVFRFFNDGSEPLVVYSVEPACGCTTVQFTREMVLKGHSGSISVTYNAATLNAFEKQIVVRSNSVTPVRVLYIRGTVFGLQ